MAADLFNGFRRRSISCLLMLCVILVLAQHGQSHAHKKRPRIVYYNSATPDDYWWRTSSEIMQAACDELGMDLNVVYVDRNQIKMVDAFKAVATGPDRPDAVVFQSLKQNGVNMLKVAEESKISAFIFNAGLTTEQAAKYGGPRQHFKYWIGQMLPDDRAAGYDLAFALYHEAVKKGLADRDGKVKFIGINGENADGAAIERSAGLALAAQQEPRIVVKQIVSGYWDRERGKSASIGLSRRYPEAKVVWAASDPMGLGVLEGMVERKVVPGKQMLVGSIDWIPEALQEVASGRMVTTIGGHFMETGWVAVLLHDYFQNKDFANESVSFKSKMVTLSMTDGADYLRDFKVENFRKIKFRQFSKVEHPKIKHYNFDFTSVVKNVVKK